MTKHICPTPDCSQRTSTQSEFEVLTIEPPVTVQLYKDASVDAPQYDSVISTQLSVLPLIVGWPGTDPPVTSKQSSGLSEQVP